MSPPLFDMMSPPLFDERGTLYQVSPTPFKCKFKKCDRTLTNNQNNRMNGLYALVIIAVKFYLLMMSFAAQTR